MKTKPILFAALTVAAALWAVPATAATVMLDFVVVSRRFAYCGTELIGRGAFSLSQKPLLGVEPMMHVIGHFLAGERAPLLACHLLGLRKIPEGKI